MSRSARCRDNSGFTIVELVVCLGLLALISTFALQGLSIAIRADGVMAMAEKQDEVRAERMHLRRTIEAAVPLFDPGSQQAVRLVFDGQPDRLQLVLPSDGRLEAGGLLLVELTTQAETGGEVLIASRQPVTAADGAGITRHKLFDGIDGIVFRYFGQRAPDSVPNWHNSWRDSAALPRLVAVEISGAHASSWPPLIVPLRAADAVAN